MFTGDSIKTEAERVIKTLRPQLQMRLRFIAKGAEVPTAPAAGGPVPSDATSKMFMHKAGGGGS